MMSWTEVQALERLCEVQEEKIDDLKFQLRKAEREIERLRKAEDRRKNELQAEAVTPAIRGIRCLSCGYYPSKV